MGNIFNYIYPGLAILIGLYVFITRKNSRKSILMLLLALIAFYSSTYIFYWVSFPINLIGAFLILIFWGVILYLIKRYNSGKEQKFWYICILYVAIYHTLHYIFDPLTKKNFWYAFIFFIYTLGMTPLAVYYFKRIFNKK